eukprot:scaffold5213_cov113-Isochrysis_galbana.AAC.3
MSAKAADVGEVVEHGRVDGGAGAAGGAVVDPHQPERKDEDYGEDEYRAEHERAREEGEEGGVLGNVGRPAAALRHQPAAHSLEDAGRLGVRSGHGGDGAR